MTIALDNNLAEELINFKIKSIKDTINTILERWHESNTDDFINKVRNGEIPDAELDAITTKQLLADLSKLERIIDNIKMREI